MSTVKVETTQLHDVLNKALHLLDEASALVEPAGISPPHETLQMLHRAKNEILQARSSLHVVWAAGGQALTAAATRKPAGAEPAPESTANPQGGPRRNRFVVRTARDVNRLLLRAVIPWKLPRIEIGIDGLTPLEIQRNQDHLTRIHNASEQQIIGPVAAGAVILFGSFRIVVFHEPWTSDQDLKDFGMLLVLGLLMWLAGRTLEILWSRARLLRLLFPLRRRAQKT